MLLNLMPFLYKSLGAILMENNNQLNETVKQLRQQKNLITEKYQINEALNEEDANFIKSLLSHNYDKSFVKDIKKLLVTKINKSAKTVKSFVAEMKSGKSCNLNLEHCLQKIKNSNFDSDVYKIEQAFRKSIEDQIKQFKLEQADDFAFYFVADHVIPFRKLLQQFLQEKNLNYDSIQIYYDNQENHYKLRNKKLEKKWQKYHKNNAQLQLLTPEENLEKVEEDKKVN